MNCVQFNIWVLYWIFAFSLSVFWGLYAIWYEVNSLGSDFEEKKGNITETYWKRKQTKGLKDSCKELGRMGSLGAFISDFLLSFIGWVCLYFFLENYYIKADQSNINIFLVLVAIVCISGYGFKISEKISQYTK